MLDGIVTECLFFQQVPSFSLQLRLKDVGLHLVINDITVVPKNEQALANRIRTFATIHSSSGLLGILARLVAYATGDKEPTAQKCVVVFYAGDTRWLRSLESALRSSDSASSLPIIVLADDRIIEAEYEQLKLNWDVIIPIEPLLHSRSGRIAILYSALEAFRRGNDAQTRIRINRYGYMLIDLLFVGFLVPISAAVAGKIAEKIYDQHAQNKAEIVSRYLYDLSKLCIAVIAIVLVLSRLRAFTRWLMSKSPTRLTRLSIDSYNLLSTEAQRRQTKMSRVLELSLKENHDTDDPKKNTAE